MGIVVIVPIVGIIAVLFAAWLARDVLSRDTGTSGMQDIAGMIFEGALAFLKRQYQTIAILAVITAIVIGVLVGLFETTDQVTRGVLAGIAFIVGSIMDTLDGRYSRMSGKGTQFGAFLDSTLDRLEDKGLVAFRYATPEGDITDAANANGSARNIAGIFNAEKTVLGLMPHPEDATDALLGSTDGTGLFEGLVEALG